MNLIKRALTVAYRARDTVCLASSPRSGSTWLAEMLVELGRFDWVDEPLRMTEALSQAGFKARTYMPAPNSNVESTMRDVLRGRVGYLRVFPRPGRRLLLKFVRLNRMMRWALETFDVGAGILLVRHPCAVVSSQRDMGRRRNSVWARVSRPAPDIPDYLTDAVDSLVRPSMSVERVLAINWAVDHAIPLVHEPPPNTCVVSYENLVRETERELRALCDHCRIRYRPIDSAKPSRTASEDYQPGSQITKWREHLSLAAQKEVREVTRRLIPDCDEWMESLGMAGW